MALREQLAGLQGSTRVVPFSPTSNSSLEDSSGRGQNEYTDQFLVASVTTPNPPFPYVSRHPVFGTGELVLILNGKLHLSPGATFYRATAPGPSDTRLNAVTTSESIGTGPCDTITLSDSQEIITLAFDHTVSFCMQ